MTDFYEFDFLDDDDDIDGFSFLLTSNFRIVDKENLFCVEFHKLFKRSYKGYEKEVEIVTKSPIPISDVTNIELSDFRLSKLYKGYFVINFYNNNLFDIFLKDYELI